MEREYTVGALLVLVTIFVIALIVYFTVPEFNESVKTIADEVFGTLPKARQLSEEQYQQEEAKSVFESIRKCIEQLKEKKEGCTCFLEHKELPEEYYIRTSDDNKELRLEKRNIKVPETTNINIEGLKFCILRKTEQGFVPMEISAGAIYIKTIDEKLRIGDKEFIEQTPEFYSLKEGENTYICFITRETEEKDAIKLRELKDCQSGNIKLEEKSKEKFQYFIRLYKNCKEQKGTKKCKCGIVDFTEIPEPYEVLVSQQASGTEFFLKNTNLKETIVYNKIAKITRSFIGNLLGREKIEEFKEKERIKGIQEIVYYGYNQEIYLAKPEYVSEMPLCGGKINPYLIFDNSIPKEDYKQKIVKFSAKAEPYFETVYSEAKSQDVDLFLVAAMIQQESVWNPQILSPSGAAGLTQLMPYTAKELGLNLPNYKCKKVSGDTICECNSNTKNLCDFKNDERFNPNKNINAGIKYIKGIIKQLDKNEKVDPTFENILASYNAGPNAVIKYKGVPPFSQTKEYVKAICRFYEQLNTKVCYA